MADISTDIAQWSATAGSNSPSGGTAIGTGLDDNLRAIQAAVVAALNAKGSDIASDTTVDLSATNGLFHDITGTTTITGLGTVRAGVWKVLKFEGALTFTHNATSLILPAAANITTADGDIAIVVSEGSGNWRCVSYIKKSGAPVAIVNNSITGAMIAMGSDAQGDVLYYNGTDYVRLGAGTVYQVLKTGGAAANPSWGSPVTLGTEQASTSGTSIDFTGIPAGVRRITVNFRGVSTNGTDNLLIQIGHSGGIETSGYVGGGARTNAVSIANATSTAGLIIPVSDASEALYGTITLTLENASGFCWSMTCLVAGGSLFIAASGKTLSAELDRVRITTTGGTNTFDAGAINITYE